MLLNNYRSYYLTKYALFSSEHVVFYKIYYIKFSAHRFSKAQDQGIFHSWNRVRLEISDKRKTKILKTEYKDTLK